MNVEWNKHAQILQVNATALKTATKLVTSLVCQGHICIDTRVRESGRLLEWTLDNGDLIEVYRREDCSTGLAICQGTAVTHYAVNPDDDGFEILFEQTFDK